MDFCAFCSDDLNDNNVITVNDKPFLYCFDCMKELVSKQFENYIASIKGKSTCESDRKILLEIGPPVYFRDVDQTTKTRFEVREYKYNGILYSGIVSSPLKEGELKEFAEEIKSSGEGWPAVLDKYGL